METSGSTITVTGGNFWAGYASTPITRLVSGDSHFVFDGTGVLHLYDELDFFDVTVSGTYSVQNGDGHVQGTKTVTGTLDESYGFYLWYYLTPKSITLDWQITEMVSASIAKLNWSLITRHVGDPYYRLTSEIYDYLVSLTESGQEFEGFFVYKNQPKNQSLHFPCFIIESERGMGHHMFGGEYKEGGAITVKVMFTKRNYYELDVI
jgi:hypothetical protein